MLLIQNTSFNPKLFYKHSISKKKILVHQLTGKQKLAFEKKKQVGHIRGLVNELKYINFNFKDIRRDGKISTNWSRFYGSRRNKINKAFFYFTKSKVVKTSAKR